MNFHRVFTMIPLLAFLPQAATPAVNCGFEGSFKCTSADQAFNIIYSDNWLSTYNNQGCDRGLVLASNQFTCIGVWGSGRYQFNVNSLSSWTRFIINDKSFGSQVDMPINWVTTFGTHNSYSNFVDGSYNYIDGDQEYSISDQLIAGARSIRMDPIRYTITDAAFPVPNKSSALRMCHQSDKGGGTDLCPFDSYGRLFEYGLQELKHWLDANPGEVITVRMYRLQQSEEAEIADTIRGILGPQIILNPPCSGIACVASPDHWDPAVLGWPTLRQMRAMGKRVIFFSDLPTQASYRWDDWVLADINTDQPYPNNFTTANCMNSGGADVRQRNFAQWSYIDEDRSLSNLFNSSPGAGLIGPDDVKTATACDASIIAVDFFYAGGAAPNTSLSVPSFVPYIGGDNLTAHYKFPDPDARYVNSVWNWYHAADGSSGDTGDNGPVEVNSRGEWISRGASSPLPYACAIDGGATSQPVSSRWVITAGTGSWNGGYAACQAIHARFWAPQNGLENQYLLNAWNQYWAKGGMWSDAWINYQKTPTVVVTPTLCPPTTDGSCPLGATIVKGQPAAGGFSLSFMGGAGGQLSYSAGPLGGSPALILPQPNPVTGAENTDYVSKTMLFNWTPAVASLQPGVYENNINVLEIDPKTFVPRSQNLIFTLTVLDTPENVIVESNLTGQSVSADGAAPVTLPHTFGWHAGETHTLNAISPGNPSPGVQTVLTNWSTGATASSISYVVPATDSKVTANFAKMFALTLTANGSGTISATPPSASGYYAENTRVTITAVPDSGFSFSGFSGAITTQTNPLSVTLNGATSETAKFTALAIPITIAANLPDLTLVVDGVAFQGSKTYSWTPGEVHKIDAAQPNPAKGVKALFNAWSDGQVAAHNYTVPAATAIVTASFTETYQLTTQSTLNGSISVSPVTADGYYPASQPIQVTAVPAIGYSLQSFTGALTGNSNPQTLTLSQPATVGATFVKNVAITFASNLNGQTFNLTVDGVSMPSTSVLLWTPGSSHTLNVPAPPPTPPGQQYLFSGWQGFGAASQINVTPSVDTVFSAGFTTQYQISAAVNPAGAGQVSGTGWYNAGALVTLTATANGGFAFSGFSSFPGPGNSATFFASSAISGVASFVPANPNLSATLTVISDTNPSQVTLQAAFRNLGTGTAGGVVIDSATIVTPSGMNDVTITVPVMVGDVQGNTTVSVPLSITWPTTENKITLTLHYTANGGVVQNSQKFNLFR